MPGDDLDLQSLGLLIKPAGADCNLRCRYCFYLPKRALYPETKRHEMTREVMHRLIGQYMQMAGDNPCLGWQGGEPTTLGLDFFRRVIAVEAQYARPGQALANGFQTNGILLDDEWARFFRRYRFLVGLSLDGPQEIHDQYRRDGAGRPTFERVMAAVETLRRNDVEFNILCMVTAASQDRAEEIYDFFLAHDLRFLQFIPCVERDPQTGAIQPYSCTPQQYGRFLCQVFERWSADMPPRAYVRDLDDLLMFAATGRTPTCTFQPTCGGYLLVEHNGDVYPCDFFVEKRWRLGNVMETPLREIARSERLGEFRLGKGRCGDACRGCEWLGQCHGACPRHRFGEHGGPCLAAPSYFCEAYRMLFSRSRERLAEMAQAALSASGARWCPPGRPPG